jgi:siroheme synthase
LKQTPDLVGGVESPSAAAAAADHELIQNKYAHSIFIFPIHKSPHDATSPTCDRMAARINGSSNREKKMDAIPEYSLFRR